MMKTPRIFVSTFTGLGNQFGSLPLLRSIIQTQPGVQLFLPEPVSDFARSIYSHHVGDDVIHHYPAVWRRFAPSDWPAIAAFLSEQSISVVLNWRNEGPQWDTGYYGFKAATPGSHLTFCDGWDLDWPVLADASWSQLAVAVTQLWCPTLQPLPFPVLPRAGARIDLFTSASTINKRWSLEQWLRLIQALLENVKMPIGIHLPPDNLDLSNSFRNLLGNNQQIILFEPFEHVEHLLQTMASVTLCFSLDSFASHLCAVTGTPAVVAFTRTDPRIWAHPQSIVVQGKIPRSCPDWKVISGNCANFYSVCRPDCINESEVAPQDVLQAILNCEQLIKR
jgi:ADP-heptose:LPS heptosyltransferase